MLSDCSDGCVVDCSCIVCIHQAGSTGQRFVSCGLAGQLLGVCITLHGRLHSFAFQFAATFGSADVRLAVFHCVSLLGDCSDGCVVRQGMLTALDRVRSSGFAASICWMFSSGLRSHICSEVSMLIVDFVFFFVSVIICNINYGNSLSSTLLSIIEYSILLFSTSYSLVLVLRNCAKNLRNLRYVGRHQRPGHHRTSEIL